MPDMGGSNTFSLVTLTWACVVFLSLKVTTTQLWMRKHSKEQSWSGLVSVRLQVGLACEFCLWILYPVRTGQCGAWPRYTAQGSVLRHDPLEKHSISISDQDVKPLSLVLISVPSADIWQGQCTDRPLNFLKTKCIFNYKLSLRSPILIIKIATWLKDLVLWLGIWPKKSIINSLTTLPVNRRPILVP